jgi:hypothetical protein
MLPYSMGVGCVVPVTTHLWIFCYCIDHIPSDGYFGGGVRMTTPINECEEGRGND